MNFFIKECLMVYGTQYSQYNRCKLSPFLTEYCDVPVNPYVFLFLVDIG